MIRLPAFSLLDEDLSHLLRLQQRHLTNYQYHSPARNKSGSTFWLPSNDELAYVTSLQLCIQYEDDCKVAAVMLDRAPKVTSLAIKLSDSELRNASHISRYESKTIACVAIRSILGAAHAHRGQLELIALSFDTIALADAGGLLQHFVNLEALQHLQLLRCEYVDPFLEHLAHECSDLSSFALEHCLYHRDASAINDFIKATTPRRLVLKLEPSRPSRFDAQGMASFDTLLPFAHAIQCLVLDDNNPNYSVHGPIRTNGYSVKFQELCKSLQSLQQLSVASPPIEQKHCKLHGFLEFLVGGLSHCW